MTKINLWLATKAAVTARTWAVDGRGAMGSSCHLESFMDLQTFKTFWVSAGQSLSLPLKQ